MLNILRWPHLHLAPMGPGAGQGPGTVPGESEDRSGDELLRMLADGELLARHALRERLNVAEADIVLLGNARRQLPNLRADAAGQQALVAALKRLNQTATVSVGELRAQQGRGHDLADELWHAKQLMFFAAEQGRAIDETLTRPILELSTACEAESVTEAQEQAFLDAYRRLAAEMAPVTSATLQASRQRIPRLGDLFTRPRRFVDDLSRITLGRFAHFLLFTLVLMCAGAVIAYQTVGEAAFARWGDLGQRQTALQTDLKQAKVLQRDRQRELYALTLRKDARGDEVTLADVRLHDAMDGLAQVEQQIGQIQEERVVLTATLKSWAQQPCHWSAVQWICGFSLSAAGRSPSESEVVFDAEMALRRLNVIVLPMLLGLLGAYAYVLRTVSREIRERSFAENSALHHVVRLSLGALAGIAAGWFLKPEQVGLLTSVPAWVMAFVAGYGIELLFAFLDRVVAAFTSQQSTPAS